MFHFVTGQSSPAAATRGGRAAASSLFPPEGDARAKAKAGPRAKGGAKGGTRGGPGGAPPRRYRIVDQAGDGSVLELEEGDRMLREYRQNADLMSER